MDEWTNPATYNSKPGPYWVMADDGWAYWAEAITPDTATGLLLDNIMLTANIEDDWYYAVEPVASFATFNEVDLLKAGSDQDGIDLLAQITKPTVTSLTIYPASPSNEITLNPGDTRQLSTVVNGENFPSQEVTYSLAPATGSVVAMDSATMVDSKGILTVSRNELNTELALTITPVADPTKAATVKVNVTIPFESFVYDLSYGASDPAFGDASTVTLLMGDDPDNNYIVDWGDGTTTGTNIATHDYGVTSGEFTITVSGRTPGGIRFNYGGYYGYGEGRLTTVVTPLLQQSSTTMASIFSYCSNLMEIPSGLFDNNTKVTSFGGTFLACSNLIAIPDLLFNKHIDATTFESTFSECSSLIRIPENLFANNTKATNFAWAFNGCTTLTSIPDGLFNKNTQVTNFRDVFNSCTSLETIPNDLFANNPEVTTFYRAFYGCTGIDGDLPEWWNDASYPSSTHPQFHLDLTASSNALRMFTNCTNATNYGVVDPNWK
jgi:hypothetical protein